MDRGTRLRKLLVEDGREEVEDESGGETDLLHRSTSVQLVIDEERSQVVADQGDGRVEETVLPDLEHRRVRVQDFQEGALEDLVAIEEDAAR